MSQLSIQTAPGSHALSGIIRGYNRSMSESLERIATGLRVNKPSDDIMTFFRAKNLNSLADDSKNVAAGIEEHLGRLSTTENALQTIAETIDKMTELAKEASQNDNAAERKALGREYDDLKTTINTLVATTRYKGALLLDGSYDTNSVTDGSAGKGITVQVGEDVNDTYSYEILDTRTNTDGVVGANLIQGLNLRNTSAETEWESDKTRASSFYDNLTQEDAGQVRIRRNITRVSSHISLLNGARNNLEVKQSNYTAAASALAGVDQAEETSRYTSLQIQQQAAASFLAQSNMAYGSVMGMLTGYNR